MNNSRVKGIEVRDASLSDFARIGVETGTPQQRVTFHHFPCASLLKKEMFSKYYMGGRYGVGSPPPLGHRA